MNALKIIVVTLFVTSVGFAVFYKEILSTFLLPQYITWAHDIELEGLKAGTPLNTEGLALAKDIGIKQPEKVRVVYVDTVPFPHDNFMLKTLGEALGFIGEGIVNNAQVFGYSIYVRDGFELDRPKLAHELLHVLQIERSSLEKITVQHLSDLAEYGYSNAPLEVEAFKANKKYGDG